MATGITARPDLESLIDARPEDEYFAYHRSALKSPELHQAELRHIFDRSWLYLGHESEVPAPGDFVRRTVATRPLFLVRGRKSGELRVFANSCTHRGATICRRERGNVKAFQCFYHAWTFDTEGNLVGVPGENSYGGFWDKSKLSLVQVRWASYRGFIFVNYDRSAEPLPDYLGEARQHLDNLVDASAAAAALMAAQNGAGDLDESVRARGGLEVLKGSHQYGTNANWKLLVENSMDGYHPMATHATYFQYLKGEGIDVSAVAGTSHVFPKGHAMIEYSGAWGRPVARWTPEFADSAKLRIDAIRAGMIEELGDLGHRMAELNRNLFIYPNLFITDNNAVALRVIEPTAPEYMDVAQYEIAPVGEDPVIRKTRLESYMTFNGPGGLATPDDVEALESCQQGAQSGIVEWSVLSRGHHDEVPDLKSEAHLRAFWTMWQRQLLDGSLAEAA